MLKRYSYVLFALTIIALPACKNTLNPLAPYKDISIVYGLMDQNDTAHYIRVNKAYEGPGNALTMAAQYDSINYPAGVISVQLQDINTNGNVVSTITLDTTSAIQVVPGIFSYPKQLLYYTKAALNVNDQYNLIITNEKTGKQVTGSTSLLQDVILNGIGISSTLSMSWFPNLPSTLSWTAAPGGAIYQMTMRFYYQETNTTSHVTTLKYADWVFAPKSGSDSSNYNYTYTGYLFLQFLASSLSPAALNIKRTADTIDVMLTGASGDFLTYLNLSQPSLGVNQDKPFYTDLKNGIGIYTARHTQVFKKVLNNADIDSIEQNPISSNLGF